MDKELLIRILIFISLRSLTFTGVQSQSVACRPQEWRCLDGLICISRKWVCDGYTDCYDNSDENNCPSTTTTTTTTQSTTTTQTTTPAKRTTATVCQSTEIPCAVDKVCLSRDKLCNGFTDCSDRSDELGCIVSPSRTTPTDAPTTSPTTTLATSKSVRTTPVGSTTETIPVDSPATSTTKTTSSTTTTTPTTTTTATTTSTPRTTPTTTTTTTSAATTSTTTTTTKPTTTTTTMHVIPTSATATTSTTKTTTTSKYLKTSPVTFNPQQECFVNGFNCSNGQCINSAYVCDGPDDCVDDTDERNCRPGQSNTYPSYLLLTRRPQTTGFSYCTSSQFQCNATVADDNQVQQKKCIPSTWTCDGDNDCGDGSDETNCQSCQRMPAEKRLTCANGQCVSLAVRCNGRSDCTDGSDEVSCWCDGQRTKVKCDVTSCVNIRLWCDGHVDCANSADESTCRGNNLCPDGSLRCNALANGVCLPPSYECNRITDCPDFSDEANCSCSSLYGYRCDMGYCVNTGSWCNGINDCPDGSDERIGCETMCPPNQFTCPLDGTCVPPVEVCDSVNTCGDWSDEIGCPCASFELRCDMGLCIDLRYWCNGHQDCPDGSDEKPGCSVIQYV